MFGHRCDGEVRAVGSPHPVRLGDAGLVLDLKPALRDLVCKMVGVNSLALGQ